MGLLRRLHKSGCRTIRLIFNSLQQVFSWLSFSVFYTASTLMAFPFPFHLGNHGCRPICCWDITILNLGVCCYHDLDFRDQPFLFVYPKSLSLSLSLWLLRISFFSVQADLLILHGNNLLLRQSTKTPDHVRALDILQKVYEDKAKSSTHICDWHKCLKGYV